MKKFRQIVCFDLFHTLIVPKKTVTYEDILVRLGAPRELIYPFVRDQLMTKPYSMEDMVEMLFCRFNLSVQDNKDEFQEAAKSWKLSNDCEWIEGAEEFLALMRTVPETAVCLVSNATKPGWENVDQKLSVLGRFEEAHLSWKHGLVKPNSECWTQLLSRLDLSSIEPQHCFMVGDNQKDDLDVPLRMGWNVYLVVNDGKNLKEVCQEIHSRLL